MLRVSRRDGRTKAKALRLVLLMGVVLCSGISAFAEEVSDAMQQYNQGKVYRDAGQYVQAQQVFESVAADTSDIDVAFDARLSLIKMHINKTGDDAEATAAIEKLITDFPSHEETPELLNTIILRYKRTNKPDKVQYVKDMLIQNFPDSPAAKIIQAQACQPAILELVSNGDDSGALAAIDSMVTNYGMNPVVIEIIADVAKKYSEAGDFTAAKNYFKKITDNFPAGVLEDDASIQAQACQPAILELISNGDDSGALAAIDSMIANSGPIPAVLKIIDDVAKKYSRAGNYTMAKDIYSKITDNFPAGVLEDDASIQAQACQPAILELVSNGDDSGALAAIDSMIANSGAIPAVLKIIDEAAKKCGKAGNYSTAKDIYKKITDNFPAGVLEDDASAQGVQGVAEALKGVEAIEYAKDIEEDIKKGEYYQAKVTVARFIQEHRDSVGFPMVLFKIGTQFENYTQYEDANLIYDHISSGDPNSGLVILDDERCRGMAKALFMVAERYYKRSVALRQSGQKAESEELIHKAISLSERVKDKYPEQALGHMSPELYHLLAECHRKLGQYSQAIKYYKKYSTEWPDYEYSAHGQYMIGRCLEKLPGISRTEIRNAYEKVIQDFPDSSAARAARVKLGL